MHYHMNRKHGTKENYVISIYNIVQSKNRCLMPKTLKNAAWFCSVHILW